MLALCWEMKIVDYRTVLELPNEMIEVWLQYGARISSTRKERPELSPEQTAALMRASFGSHGIVRA